MGLLIQIKFLLFGHLSRFQECLALIVIRFVDGQWQILLYGVIFEVISQRFLNLVCLMHHVHLILNYRGLLLFVESCLDLH